MKILGIDPGVATTGYGIIKNSGKKMELVDYGCIITVMEDGFSKRLDGIYKEIRKLIKEHNPDVVACEEIFFFKNAKTALKVGHARGVMLLAFNRMGIEVFEYSPLHVKQVITGYGRAEKKEMQDKVQELLSLKELPKPDDAADALAVAICHIYAGQKGRKKTVRKEGAEEKYAKKKKKETHGRIKKVKTKE